MLPFDNLGDSADAYFADGVADEIRTKLAQVAGLEVIARGSSVEYQHTTRRPAAIARELGADYLLTGTVRWEKVAGGNRVRVTPELVDARAGQAARTRWVRQFDASLTDVFQVQADIATNVAEALGVALADSARRELSARPTENLAAYDEFLKGEAASRAMKGDQASLRRAIGFYERAVALDSTFVQAWSQLSRARTLPLLERRSGSGAGRAGAAGAGARPPAQAEGSLGLPGCRRLLRKRQSDRQRAGDRGVRAGPPARARQRGPARRGRAHRRSSLGRWDGVAARLARASLLDPRSANTARRLAVVHIFLRQYAAADSAADRAVALAPTNPGSSHSRCWSTVARGDLDSARAVIRAAARQIDPGTLLPVLRLLPGSLLGAGRRAAAPGARGAAERVRR